MGNCLYLNKKDIEKLEESYSEECYPKTYSSFTRKRKIKQEIINAEICDYDKNVVL